VLLTSDTVKFAVFVAENPGNLANEIQTLMSRLSHNEEDFVQGVQYLLHRSPSVVLFNKQQITDIRAFCTADAMHL